jgi:hypothetical protein
MFSAFMRWAERTRPDIHQRHWKRQAAIDARRDDLHLDGMARGLTWAESYKAACDAVRDAEREEAIRYYSERFKVSLSEARKAFP